ncbi:MAG: hypothetical protein LLG14_19395 [Nocardiaceae bacterium]|nr:hypothetical protein [Nocardiaceae bacterium]
MADRVRSLSAAALQVETTLSQLDDFTRLGTSTMQQFSEFVTEADDLILRLGRIITLIEIVLAPAIAFLHVVDYVPTQCRKTRRAGVTQRDGRRIALVAQ